MKSYMKNELFMAKPRILDLLEEKGVEIDYMNWGLGLVFDNPTSKGNDWLQSQTASTEDYFIRLAEASANGSEYYFFIVHKDLSLEHQPIVAFGSEGEVCMIAKNFGDWLLLMSIGEPVSLNFTLDGAYFDYIGNDLQFDDEDDQEMYQNLLDYRTVLISKGYKITDLSENNYHSFQEKIYEEAMAMYGETFKKVLDLFEYDYEGYEQLGI